MASVEIQTGVRLHFGLLAVRAETGRQFGGCGLMVDGLGCRLRVSAAARDEVRAPASWRDRVERALSACHRIGQTDWPRVPVLVELVDGLPQHVGLGSGTQVAMAVARGVAELDGETPSEAALLAQRVGRGRRSAIGLYGFHHGGLLVEAGKRTDDEISPLAVRKEFPPEWRFVLIRPADVLGLSGEDERHGFESLKPMPAATTDKLCRLILTELLPAITQQDFEAFADSLYEYGQLVGRYFSKAQGGVFANRSMETLCEWLRSRGPRGIGQSSWGPTLFVACSSPDHADAVVLRLADSPWKDCFISVASPRNRGADVRRIE